MGNLISSLCNTKSLQFTFKMTSVLLARVLFMLIKALYCKLKAREDSPLRATDLRQNQVQGGAATPSGEGKEEHGETMTTNGIKKGSMR